MLIAGRFPDVNPGPTASHDPCSKNDQLFNRLLQIDGNLQLADLSPSLEDPDACLANGAISAPRRKYPVFPRYRRCDGGKGLRPRDEDEIQAPAEIVGV